MTDLNNLTFGTWPFGFLAVVIGTLLLVGLATPVAGVLASLTGCVITFSWFPPPTPNFLYARLMSVFVVIVSAAIALLGPGAFSVDARLFGRREIIIPPASHSPES